LSVFTASFFGGFGVSFFFLAMTTSSSGILLAMKKGCQPDPVESVSGAE
jgi:hypothetical protein